MTDQPNIDGFHEGTLSWSMTSKFVMFVDTNFAPIVVNRDLVAAVALPADGNPGSVLLMANGVALGVALNQIDAMTKLNNPDDTTPTPPLLTAMN